MCFSISSTVPLAAFPVGLPSLVLDEALTLARQADDPFAMVFALLSLGVVNIMTDPSRAQPHLDEAARIARLLIDRSLAQLDNASKGIRLHDLQLDYVRAQFQDREALNLIRALRWDKVEDRSLYRTEIELRDLGFELRQLEDRDFGHIVHHS